MVYVYMPEKLRLNSDIITESTPPRVVRANAR